MWNLYLYASNSLWSASVTARNVCNSSWFSFFFSPVDIKLYDLTYVGRCLAVCVSFSHVSTLFFLFDDFHFAKPHTLIRPQIFHILRLPMSPCPVTRQHSTPCSAYKQPLLHSLSVVLFLAETCTWQLLSHLTFVANGVIPNIWSELHKPKTLDVINRCFDFAVGFFCTIHSHSKGQAGRVFHRKEEMILRCFILAYVSDLSAVFFNQVI